MDTKQMTLWVKSVCKFAKIEETVEEDVAKDIAKEPFPAQKPKDELTNLFNKSAPKAKPKMMPLLTNPNSAKTLHEGLEIMQKDPTALVRMKNQLKNDPLMPTKKGPGPFATDIRKP